MNPKNFMQQAARSTTKLNCIALGSQWDHIEEEGEAKGESTHLPIPWHLDRLDQIHSCLDSSYQPIGTGKGVDVYVLDSGINYNHTEFEYRAKYPG